MRTFPRLLVVLAVAALAAPPVRAEEPEEWTFTVAPYVWFAGLEGDVAAIPGLPVASINASFGDIFEHLDPSLMLAGEVRNEQFGILFDIVYVHLSADGETPGPLFTGVDADIRNFIGTLEGAYRVVATENLKIDLLGGIRVWTVDTELSLGAGVLPARVAESKETWADPLVGVRARVDFGSGFFVNAWGNVGGFGAASDLTWDVYGGLGYEWNGWLSSIIGYRHLEVDYDHEGFLYDVSQSGPIIGAVLRF
ncbi:MAG TPA: hypothetical protein VH835_08950 [Dongiaceae bacterium]|jgi:hypothetical protein